jgi:hypothetical protein
MNLVWLDSESKNTFTNQLINGLYIEKNGLSYELIRYYIVIVIYQ